MSNKIFPTDTVAKSPLVAADLFLIADSADTNKVKDITGAVLNTFVRGAGGSIVMATGNTIGIASGGNITFTDATVDLISILAAAVKIGNGTPTQTQAAEDLYVEGKLEVDGILYADAGLTVLAGQAITDGVFSVTSGVFTAIASLTVDDITINGNAISSAGASSMTIVPTAGQLLILDGHWGFDGTGLTAQTDADTILTAYAGKKITIESVSFDGGVMAGVVSITDGTASWASSSLSGFTSISGTTLTDGVASLNAGSLAALVNLTLGSATVNAGVFSMIQGATASDPTFSITQTGNDVAIAQTVGKMNLTAVGEVVINDASADVDFRVETDAQKHAFFIDAGLNSVGFINGTVAGTPLEAGTIGFVKSGAGAGNLVINFDHYGNDTNKPYLAFRKSASDTMSTLARTTDGSYFAVFDFYGVDEGGARARGALINVIQDGATATYAPTNIVFSVCSGAALVEALRLGSDEIVINEASADVNFRIESDGNANMIFVDAGLNRVGIGTSSLSYTLEVNAGADDVIAQFTSTDAYADILITDASGTAAFSCVGGVAYINRITNTEVRTPNHYPIADDTYYLGKNDDDSPAAWKGVIVKDTTNGKYYRVEVINGTVTATDLTD